MNGEGGNNTFNPNTPQKEGFLSKIKSAFRQETPPNLAAEAEKRNVQAIVNNDISGNMTQEQAEFRLASMNQTGQAQPYTEQNVRSVMAAENVASQYGLKAEDIEEVRKRGMPAEDVSAWASMQQARRIQEKRAADRANYVPRPEISGLPEGVQIANDPAVIEARRKAQEQEAERLSHLQPSLNTRTQDELNRMQHFGQTTGPSGQVSEADRQLAQARAINANTPVDAQTRRRLVIEETPNVATPVPAVDLTVDTQPADLTPPPDSSSGITEVETQPDQPIQTPKIVEPIAVAPSRDIPDGIDNSNMEEPIGVEDKTYQLPGERNESIVDEKGETDSIKTEVNLPTPEVNLPKVEMNLTPLDSQDRLKKYEGLSFTTAYYADQIDQRRGSLLEQGKLQKTPGPFNLYSEVAETKINVDGQIYEISMQSSVGIENKPTYSDGKITSVEEIWIVSPNSSAELYLLSLDGKLYKGVSNLKKKENEEGYVPGVVQIDADPIDPEKWSKELGEKIQILNRGNQLAA